MWSSWLRMIVNAIYVSLYTFLSMLNIMVLISLFDTYIVWADNLGILVYRVLRNCSANLYALDCQNVVDLSPSRINYV